MAAGSSLQATVNPIWKDQLVFCKFLSICILPTWATKLVTPIPTTKDISLSVVGTIGVEKMHVMQNVLIVPINPKLNKTVSYGTSEDHSDR